MKIKLVICSIIFTIVFGICNNIYAREYINNTNLEMETTISSHAGNVEELTNEFGIYYTVTFIDEVRNTRVVKRVKEGDVVKPELVSDEYIYINEETFQFFENWTIHRGGKNIIFNFEEPILQNTTLYADYSTTYEMTPDPVKKIIIRFDTQEGTNIKKQHMLPYNKIKQPKEPQKNGYKFLGWYTNIRGGKKWDFNKNLANDSIILYAHWEYVGTGSNISPQTGYNVNWVFAILIMSLGTAVFSSVKLSYKK